MIFDKIFSSRDVNDERLWSSSRYSTLSLPVAGVHVDEDIALTYGAVFSCVKIISEAIAALPWRVHKLDGRMKSIDSAHPADRLLKTNPNEYMKPFDFKSLMCSCCLLWGNFYAEIERNGRGRPIGLWPISPKNAELKLNSDGSTYLEVRQESGVTV